MDKSSTMQLYYRLTLKDKDGNVIKKSRLRKSHSFTLQFLQLFVELLGSTGASLQVRDITNTLRSGDSTYYSNVYLQGSDFLGTSNDTTKGIVVGTGTDAPANNDYKLQTLIAAGSGSGQLNYGSQGFVTCSIVAGNVDYVLSRVFTNGSGSTITIEEIGVHAYWGYSPRYSYLIIHDLAEQEVDDGQSLTVEYIFRTTV